MTPTIINGLDEDWVELTSADAANFFVQVQQGFVQLMRTSGAKPGASSGYVVFGPRQAYQGAASDLLPGAAGGRIWAYAPGDPNASVAFSAEDA